MSNKAKILSFNQNSDFYLRTGDKKADKSDWVAAVSRYAKAYEKDFSNHDACLAYAEMLNHMQFYEESNRVIFRQISMFEPLSDYMFGIACNFYGMYEFERAKECLLSYLNVDPDGFYAYNASEFLDVLDDTETLADELELGNDESVELVMLCTKAKNFIRSKNYTRAKEILKYTIENTGSWRAKLLLASLNLEEGKITHAGSLADEVLLVNGDAVQAKCIRAFVLKKEGKTEQSLKMLNSIHYEDVYDIEVLQNAATQYLELNKPEISKRVLKNALQISPYNRQSIHLYAYSCCCMGDFSEAAKCYENLIKINSHDIIASYYLSECSDGKLRFHKKNWSLKYELPMATSLVLSSTLDNILNDYSDAEYNWSNNNDFQNRIEWALNGYNHDLQIRIFRFLEQFRDVKSEMLLRDYLLRMDQPDDMKKQALISLKHMHAKSPFMCYMDGEWIESRVNALNFKHTLPPACTEIIAFLFANTQNMDNQEKFIEACYELLNDTYKKLKKNGKRITRNQVPTIAAALEVLNREDMNLECDMDEITNKYGISNIRLKNMLSKLKGNNE